MKRDHEYEHRNKKPQKRVYELLTEHHCYFYGAKTDSKEDYLGLKVQEGMP